MALHHDLLKQAKMLAQREPKRPKQSSLRRAVSTAYYALFHLLINESLNRSVQTDARDYVARSYEHGAMKAVCEEWGGANLTTGKGISRITLTKIALPIEVELQTIATTFKDLQEARHEADYDVTASLNKLDVLGKIQRVETAFQDLETVKRNRNTAIFLAALLFQKMHKNR